uniref:Uncharacterized protein n=1 Tax=Glossina brevipalpis TaxID=37001 RepID=A0A1A9WQA7_9MUSC
MSGRVVGLGWCLGWVELGGVGVGVVVKCVDGFLFGVWKPIISRKFSEVLTVEEYRFCHFRWVPVLNTYLHSARLKHGLNRSYNRCPSGICYTSTITMALPCFMSPSYIIRISIRHKHRQDFIATFQLKSSLYQNGGER